MRALLEHELQAVVQVAPHADMGSFLVSVRGRRVDSGQDKGRNVDALTTVLCARHVTCKDPGDLWSERAGYVTRQSGCIHTAETALGLPLKSTFWVFFFYAELGLDGSGRFECMCERGKAWETQSGDGGRGSISDRKGGGNNRTPTVIRIPTRVSAGGFIWIVSNPHNMYAVRSYPLILYFLLSYK